MASAEAWVAFSREWMECLSEAPKISRFKMREAAGPQGHGDFEGIAKEIRNFKLRKLAAIITRHAMSSFVCWIDLAGHAETYGSESDPLTPYHLIFHTMIAAVTHELISRGHRERCEIVFDDQGVIGKRAKQWYPLLYYHLILPRNGRCCPSNRSSVR